MKKIVFVAFFALYAAAIASPDDQLSRVQEQLKEQGFYYGTVDGEFGGETSAAIKRYQIRNGLEVTGTLTQETLKALNVGGGTPSRQVQTRQPVSTPPVASSKKSINDTDREFLQQQGGPVNPPPGEQPPVQQQAPPPPPQDPHYVAQPVEIPPQATEISSEYAVLFRRTPYENAPIDLQQETLKRAQWRLVHERFYDGAVDGIPGPGTSQAIVMFQGIYRLPQTGRLDINTLGAMRLLPDQRRVVVQPYYDPYFGGPQRVYRGIWVH